MNKTIEIGGKQGDIEEKSIAFRYNIETDSGGLVDVLGCEIIFVNNNGETKVCPLTGNYEDLWDQLGEEDQNDAIWEDDPLDRDVQYREQRRIFENKYRRGIN